MLTPAKVRRLNRPAVSSWSRLKRSSRIVGSGRIDDEQCTRQGGLLLSHLVHVRVIDEAVCT